VQGIFEKSVLDANSCLHYLLPPPRPDSVYASPIHSANLKLLDIITLLYPMLLIIICLLVHSRS